MSQKLKIGARVIMVLIVLLYLHQQSFTSEKSAIATVTVVPKPLVSFVIPSTLERNTLKLTIASLLSQSIQNWEAIIGVDVEMSKYKDYDLILSRSRIFSQDPRLRFVPVYVNNPDRGSLGNGAGNVRNIIVRYHATADWVAFVDDDDSLSPDYIELLKEETELDRDMDIYIFRMFSRGFGVLPPYKHGRVVTRDWVGISFAVRRHLFTRDNSALSFVPSHQEDFYFLFAAQNQTKINLGCEVGYFVRMQPTSVKSSHTCKVNECFMSPVLPVKNIGELLWNVDPIEKNLNP